MNKKIALSTAYKLAKQQEIPYSGEKSVAALTEWWDGKLATYDEDGNKVALEIVDDSKATKGLTLSVSRNSNEADTIELVDGEGEPEAESMDEGEDDEAEAKSRRTSRDRTPTVRGKHSSAEINRAQSGIHSPEGIKRLSMRKAYDRKDNRRWSSGDEAEAFAAWFRQKLSSDIGRTYKDYKFDRDLCKKAGLSSQDALGGALVPEVFEPTLIKLREEYGTATRLIPVTTMTSAVEVRPRRTSGITITAHSEGAAITESSPQYDNIELVAKEWAALTYLPISLLNTAAIDLDAEVVDEMSYAYAQKIDDVVFNGDGTSTYFGIQGFRSKLRAVDATIANIEGLVVATGNAYSEVTLQDFIELDGVLPAYAEARSDGWVAHKKTWSQTATRVANAAGGVYLAEVTGSNVTGQRQFLNSPVSYVQNMPSTEANSQIFALLGDFSEAAKIGRVQNSLSMEADTSYRFGNGQIAYRMLDQIAVNVHDVGSTSEAGPVVGLITAAS